MDWRSLVRCLGKLSLRAQKRLQGQRTEETQNEVCLGESGVQRETGIDSLTLQCHSLCVQMYLPELTFQSPILERVDIICIVLLPSASIVTVSKSRKRAESGENIK